VCTTPEMSILEKKELFKYELYLKLDEF